MDPTTTSLNTPEAENQEARAEDSLEGSEQPKPVQEQQQQQQQHTNDAKVKTAIESGFHVMSDFFAARFDVAEAEDTDAGNLVRNDLEATEESSGSKIDINKMDDGISSGTTKSATITSIGITKQELIHEEEVLANTVNSGVLLSSVDAAGVGIDGIPGAFAFVGEGNTDIEAFDPSLDDANVLEGIESQQSTRDPNMPVANLVREQASPTAEAQEVDPAETIKRSESFAVLTSISLVVVICAIVLAVVFILMKGNDTPGSQGSGGFSKNASQPTTTMAQIPIHIHILGLLSNETVKNIEAALGELGPSQGELWLYQNGNFSALTPQQKAYQWVLQDPNISSLSDQRIVQRFALATFFHATSGPSWRNSDDWMSYEVHECSWFKTDTSSPNDSPDIFNMQVANDTELGRSIPCNHDSLYEFLRLKENDLDGTIPAELVLLSNLKGISLESNNIRGTIPTEIGTLSNLEEWFMYKAALTGTIPTQVGLLGNMMFMNLFLNSLTGTVPSELGLVPDMVCSISGNNLVGSLPSELGLMRDLPWLHENALTGTLPTEFQDMPDLTKLYLTTNNFNGTLPRELFLQSTNLEELWISVNSFSGSVPSEIGLLTKLHSILASANDFTGSLPTEIGNLDALSVLRLGKTKMSSTLPSEIGLLTNLTSFHIPRSGYFGPIPSEFGALNALMAFNGLRNSFSGSLPTNLGGLSRLTTKFDLARNNFTGPIPSELGNMRSASLMSFPKCGLTGTLPTELGRLHGATTLDFSDNMLSGGIPSELGLLDSNSDVSNLDTDRNISNIKLSGNLLTGPVPSSLGSLRMITLLELYNNTGLSGEIPRSLCDLETWPTGGGIKIDCNVVRCSCNATCVCT